MKRWSSETWLEPAVAIEFKACRVLPSKQAKSWENPPVTPAPARSSSCIASSQKLALRPQWLQPAPIENAANLEAAGQQGRVCTSVAPDSKVDTVELTLASVLLATSLNTDAVAEARTGHAERVKKVLLAPCLGRGGCEQRCSRCAGKVAEEDAVLFCTLFAAMPKKQQVQVLNTTYHSGSGQDNAKSERKQWTFLGNPICVQRLSSLLGIAMRSFYKSSSTAHQRCTVTTLKCM
jgi:hypothetical protein